jgi:GH25 family lysozyme M1 (1,4-beta-N-acetylmuramidase)
MSELIEREYIPVERDPRQGRTIGNCPPSITSRLKGSILSALAKASISGLDPSTLALWADCSHWNKKINVRQMVAGGLHGLMAKCSDGAQLRAGAINDPSTRVDDTFSDNVQQAYDAGIPLIAYHYFQPGMILAAKPEDDRQFQALKYALKNKIAGKSYHAIAIDVEEKGGAPHHTVYRDRLQTFYAWCLKEFDVPILFYTGVGFLAEFPAVRDWLAEKDNPKHLWLAQWVYTTKTRATWAQVKAKIASLNYKVITPGFATWVFTQITAAFWGMDGCGEGEIDLNLYHGTPAECYAWLKYSGTAQPEPEPETPEPAAALVLKVKGTRLRLRAKPGLSGAVVGWLEKGTPVPVHGLVYASRGTWIDTGTGYACYADLFGQYME